MTPQTSHPIVETLRAELPRIANEIERPSAVPTGISEHILRRIIETGCGVAFYRTQSGILWAKVTTPDPVMPKECERRAYDDTSLAAALAYVLRSLAKNVR